MKLLPALLASVLAFLPPLQAETDWPEFRGPLHNGHAPEADVPLTWSSRENVRWKIAVPGRAWSTPVARGDRFWITTAVMSDDRLSLEARAYWLEDGSPIWKQSVFELETPRIHQKNSHASPSPYLVGNRLVVHFGPHGTAALDAETGEVHWRQTGLTYSPVHGPGGSPAVGDGRIFLSCDGADDPFVVALSLADGSILWKTMREVEVTRPFSFSTPRRFSFDGRNLVAVPGSGAVIAYDETDGDEVWRFRYGEGFSVVPRPVFHDDHIYVCSGFMRATLYAIRLGGSGDITDSHLAWSDDKAIPRESSPIVVDDLLYISDDKGILSCFDAKNGEEKYRERLEGAGGYSASPVYASGHLFFHSGQGLTTVVKPGETFEKVAENDLAHYGLSSLAVLEDGFLIRSENHIYRIGE